MIQQAPLKKSFYYALGFHGAIVIFLLIISFSFPEKIFQEQSVNIINANALSSLPSQAAPQQPVDKPTPPVPVPKQPTPEPRQEKQIHRRTITKEPAVEQTVVKNATIDKKEHLAKLKQKRRAEKLAHEKQLRAKQLARQKELAHEKAVAEQNRLKALHAQQIQGTIDRYQAMILQAISEHWLIPPGVDKQLSCRLNIQLGPDGSVLNVMLSESSGNVLLDRSAVAAVYKSSPLPVPTDPDAFDSFRNFDLIVRPEDIIN